MAKEFAGILNNIKRKPMEDKVQALGNIVEKLIQTVLNVSNNTEIMLNTYKKEIETLRQEIKIMRLSQTKIDIKQLGLKPPEPLQSSQLTSKPIPPVPTRNDLNNELNAIFKKNRIKNGEKEELE